MTGLYIWRDNIRDPKYINEVLTMKRSDVFPYRWQVKDTDDILIAEDRYQNDIKERFEKMGYIIQKIGV